MLASLIREREKNHFPGLYSPCNGLNSLAHMCFPLNVKLDLNSQVYLVEPDEKSSSKKSSKNRSQKKAQSYIEQLHHRALIQ